MIPFRRMSQLVRYEVQDRVAVLTVDNPPVNALSPGVPEGISEAIDTSTLDIDGLAAASGRPAQVIGHHVFSPANVMRLLEIVRGRGTSREAIATSLKLPTVLARVAAYRQQFGDYWRPSPLLEQLASERRGFHGDVA